MPRNNKPPLQQLPVYGPDTGPSYYVMGSNKEADLRASAEALKLYNGIRRTQASILGQDLSDLQPNVSARPEFNRGTYESYRPSETIPRRYDTILDSCEKAYQGFGIVKNTIDLCSDFASQGIRISHPKPAIQKFFREWWEKIKGEDRSERFLNCLYKLGTTVARMQTATVPLKDKRKLVKAGDISPQEHEIKLRKREIPWKYTFLHPGLVKTLGGPLAAFLPKEKLYIEIPYAVQAQINRLPANNEILKSIPSDILRAIKSPNRTIELEEDRTFIFYYKKDDWQNRPFPMVYPILKHLFMLEKLALADSAALDGAISNLRIIRLGSLEHKIAPTAAATARLSEILEANVAAGTLDLVWDAAIDLIESKTDVHNFLGSEKYQYHLEQVYIGLGIPTTLTGSGQGTTNNMISLKVLIKRLQYGRAKLREFWGEQLAMLQRSMGFKEPAIIEFDYADDFGDENTYRRLLIEMADRELISDEVLQYSFGFMPELENMRINKERKERQSKKRGNKIGPFTDADPNLSLQKIALTQKLVNPEQVGVELKESKEKSPFDKQLDVQKQRTSTTGKPAGKSTTGKPGRKSGSKDKVKRKTKTFKPKVRAAMEIWATESLDRVSDILKPIILQHFNKKNIRSLSSEETKLYEKLKFGVFTNIEAFTQIDEEAIGAVINESPIQDIIDSWQNTKFDVISQLERELTLEEEHQLQCKSYVDYYIGEDNVESNS